MSYEGCKICGCSSDFDEVGDRICGCDSCKQEGCQFSSQYYFTDNGKTKIYHDGIKHIKQDPNIHYCVGDVTTQHIVLPNDVKIIGTWAFLKYKALKRITIPPNVEVICDSAFHSCICLEEIIFEEGSKLEKIENCAFMDTKSLNSINIPEGVSYIGENCFTGSNISSIILPKLEKLNKGTFYNCGKLKNIEIQEGLINIDDFVFYACYELRELCLPQSIINISDRAIPRYLEIQIFLGKINDNHMNIDIFKYFICEGYQTIELEDNNGSYFERCLWFPEESVHDNYLSNGSYFPAEINSLEPFSTEGLKIDLGVFTLGGEKYNITDWGGKDHLSIKTLLLEENPELKGDEFQFLFEGMEETIDDISPLKMISLFVDNIIDITKPILLVWV